MSDKKDSFQITIKQGMEHHSNLMDIYDENDFFYSSYQQAAYAITKIVEMSNFMLEENDYDKRYGTYHQNFEYHNNIVAFCADRGQGKTSAMLSMADALDNMITDKKRRSEKDKEQAKEQAKIKFWNERCDSGISNPVLDTHFECLTVIDPNCFEKNASVLRTVISKMFKSAADKWKRDTEYFLNSDTSKEKQKKKELLADKFLACIKGLDYLHKEKEEVSSYYDDLNMAAEYGDNSNFKSSLIELVDLYLQFMSPDNSCSKQNSMMVIMIDDVDLNTERAYSIVEEIRKYFVMPRVLILMALHIGTLSRSLEQNQLQQYKVLIECKSKEDPSIKERCHRAMERYISKLLPSSHRIYLPSISGIIESNYNKVNLSYLDKDGNDILSGYDYLIKEKNLKDNYENRLFMLIYAKTGIMLCKQGDYIHEFLPNNFRQLNHFLFYMNSMKDIFSKDDKKPTFGLFEKILNVKANGKKLVTIWRKNLTLFQNYFLNSWCPERLDDEHLRIIEDIHKSPSNIKNFNTVAIIGELIKKNDPNKQQNQPDINDIREQPIKSSGYTPFSDVIWSLNVLKHSVNPVHYFTFIYAVKMYYTIYTHIIASQGIWDCLGENPRDYSPFKTLFGILGGRIFPMHYYAAKKLPLYVLEWKTPQIFEKGEYEGLFFFMSKATRPSQTNTYYRSEIPLMIFGENSQNQETPYYKHNSGFHYKCNVDFREGVLEKTEDPGKIKLSTKYVFFDFFQPIMNLLKHNYENIYYNKQYLGVLYSVLALVCNLDLQDIIYKKYFKIPYTDENLPKKDENQSPGQNLRDMFIEPVYKKICDNEIKKGIIFDIEFDLYKMFDKELIYNLASFPYIQKIIDHGINTDIINSDKDFYAVYLPLEENNQGNISITGQPPIPEQSPSTGQIPSAGQTQNTEESKKSEEDTLQDPIEALYESM